MADLRRAASSVSVDIASLYFFFSHTNFSPSPLHLNTLCFTLVLLAKKERAFFFFFSFHNTVFIPPIYIKLYTLINRNINIFRITQFHIYEFIK